MAQIVGDFDVALNGATYVLHMGMAQLGTLQDEFGTDLAPFMVLPKPGSLPRFSAYVRLVEVALNRYHPDAPDTLAGDLVTANPMVVAELLAAAFPDAKLQAGASPGKRKAATRG